MLEYYNGLGLDYLDKKQYAEADTLYTYLLATYEKQQPGSDINWAQIILKGKADVLLIWPWLNKDRMIMLPQYRYMNVA